MINNNALAIIPARGGSKGLPGKNIRLLGDIPLIAWTIQAALTSKCFTKVIVSTDCHEIANIAKKFGAEVPFIRPDQLATDTATSVDVVMHAINALNEKYDEVVLLQPTSPFRKGNDIRNAFDVYNTSKVQSLVSVTEVDKSPYWCFSRNENQSITPIVVLDKQFSRRQDMPTAYSLNGAIYIVGTEKFMNDPKFIYHNTLSYVMNKKSSIDVDDLIDFKLAELLLGET